MQQSEDDCRETFANEAQALITSINSPEMLEKIASLMIQLLENNMYSDDSVLPEH